MFKKLFKKKFDVKVYMKSGNVVSFKTTNITCTKKPGELTKLEWDKIKGEALLFVDLEQVEAVWCQAL